MKPGRKYQALAVLLAGGLSACSALQGDLRDDLNDAPDSATYGGRWPEKRNLTDEDRHPSAVGHSENRPGTQNRVPDNQASSWVSDRDLAADRKDAHRFAHQIPGEPQVSGFGAPSQTVVLPANRVTKRDFEDTSFDEGSLWAGDGQTNFFFSKNKVRGVGDIIQVSVEEALLKDIYIETAKSLSDEERDTELKLAKERLKAAVLGQEEPSVPGVLPRGEFARKPKIPKKPKDTKGKEPEIDVDDLPDPTEADIDLSKSLDLKTGDTLMAEIVDRYPNGNYKIRGMKRVPYLGGSRWVEFTAIAKGNDITDDETINSGKLYEYKVNMLR